MKQSAQKGNAPEVAATEASSVKNQRINQGINMSDSTQVQASRAITVPFHGAELYVVEHNGLPYTPMKPIAEGMGLAWQPQHRKLSSNDARWGITMMVIPAQQGVTLKEIPSGGSQQMLMMPLRKLPGWLATIDSGRIKNLDVRARVIQYQNECDDALWQYWNDGLAVNHRAFSVHAGQTLAAEQADELRHLVEGWAKKLSADTKVQGKFILQAWSKLKSHFKVGYRQIPQECLHEALSIVGRHAADWEVVDDAPTKPVVDLERATHALSLVAEVLPHVSRSLFEAVMTEKDWQADRFLVSFDIDANGLLAKAKKIDPKAYVLPMQRFQEAIDNCISLDADTLTTIAAACMRRLGYMAARGASAQPSVGHS